MKWILFFLLFVNITWVYYVAIIRLYREKSNLNYSAKVMAYIGAGIGIPLDIMLNIVASILLLDIPKEITLSQHLSRLNDDDGWRGNVARWICTELLDPFDPSGRHCK